MAADEEVPVKEEYEMKTGTKTKTAKTKTNRTNQACTEIGEGHEGKGGEQKSASWDLCHKKGRQAEK